MVVLVVLEVEELGGLRGMDLYTNRVAIQGDRGLYQVLGVKSKQLTDSDFSNHLNRKNTDNNEKCYERTYIDFLCKIRILAHWRYLNILCRGNVSELQTFFVKTRDYHCWEWK